MPSESLVSRRGLLAILGGAASIGLGAVFGTDAARPPLSLEHRVPAGEWPMAKRTPRRTGFQPQPGPQDGLVEAWRQPVESANVVSPGLVATNDRVYIVGRYAVRALASTDGRPDWVRPRENAPSVLTSRAPFEFLQTGPTVSGDQLYVVGGVTLYGLDATSGQSTWAFRTTSSFEHVLPVGNLVVVGVSRGSEDHLVALDQSTSFERWTQATAEVPLAFASGTEGHVDAPLLLTGTTAQGDNRQLVGRDPVDGSVDWRTTADAPTFEAFALPAISRGRVYAGGSRLTAFAATDGSVEWQTPIVDRAESISPVTDGERVYGVGGGVAMAVDAATGTRQWSVSVGDVTPFVPPVIAGETLYVPGDDAIIALDTTDGSTRFRHALPASTPDGMASADGNLYVRTHQSVRGYVAPEEGDS
ncbi:PQQ-binding-like beta-propeller repeat protein [Haloferax sp. AB510]|uniref:outer membrane protein assembly factor BamB family protein n=2 Tax=unclassified Haloferax TaxID=2625095 RepID=UPI00209BE900|nr:PQQ-binding-like beta-propeller repeat protein [Haloferax sp. AB510]MCO8265139.1 PQQ-binding-like beta-propeller repeat protein [Haloferax sp. AB510]